jgi:hypothetical protein
MERVTITRRSRGLSIGFTTQLVQTTNGLVLEQTKDSRVPFGMTGAIEAAYEAARSAGGCDFRLDLYVRGRRVVNVLGSWGHNWRWALTALKNRYTDSIEVEVE